jgi:DNA-binding NtrC family response regulator
MKIAVFKQGITMRKDIRTLAMKKILLVDDENLIRYSLSTTLRRGGSEVTAVANGKDALNEVNSTSFDICFLDVNLPDANGLELMKTVRKVSPATKIIIMTAVDLDERQMQNLRDCSSHFLPKPFDLEQVRSLVDGISKNEDPAAYDA